ncbi:hypothetical protein BROUX41_004983 [Berkeleyomyces rouxiae]|uniref:uncharacterized protein n=1 Tax=Berkeleyomyces rouxiae TaxID=2035830 RepID=UPI003B79DB8C
MQLIHALAAAAVASEAVMAREQGFDSLLVNDDKTETTNMRYPLNPWAFFDKPSSTAPRRVAYFNYGGRIIVNGDEIYGSKANMDEAIVRPGQAPRSISVQKNEYSLWRDGEIKYYWYDEASEQMHGEMFNEAIRIWKAKLPWLRFTMEGYKIGSRPLGPVVVQSVKGSLTTSSFGHTTNPQANYLLLGTTENVRDYVHQIGHLLGLAHEHQRPDRDQHLDLFCDRIRCTNKFNPMTNEHLECEPVNCEADTCTGYGCNFVPFDLDGMKLETLGEYDVNSVMHIDLAAYGSPLAKGNPLEPKDGVVFPPLSVYPSVVDAQRVCNLYPESCTSVCGNGIVEAGEECDDGNNDDNDSCTVECKLRTAQVEKRDDDDEKKDAKDKTSKTEQKKSDGKNKEKESEEDKEEKPVECIDQCKPWPGVNKCHQSTSCIGIFKGVDHIGYRCVCAAGFRAAKLDPEVAIRLPWEGQSYRVYVEPGVECNTRCNDNWCDEVAEQAHCYQ